MTWTKLPGNFTDRPDLLQVPRSVRFLHVEALVWSNQHGTDGQIPRHALGRITDEPDADLAAKQLVESGAWIATDQGWEMVGFLDDQPSAADVRRTQKLADVRNRRQRQHRQGDHSLCDERYCREASRVDNAQQPRVDDAQSLYNGNVTRAETEPSRAEPKERRRVRRGEGGADARSARATRAGAAPEGWDPRLGLPPGVQPEIIVEDHT
jgi:hypothetical protein